MPARSLKLVRPANSGAAAASEDRLSALTALEREFLPPLLEIQETPPSPLKRAVLWSVVALVALLLTWATVGEIDVVASVPGRFVPDGKVKTVQPIDAAIIRAIHVKDGQAVRRGDLLIDLDPTVSGADLAASREKLMLVQLDMVRLQGELAGKPAVYNVPGVRPELITLQEALRTARDSAHAAKRSEATSAVEARASALASGEATLKRLQETLVIAQEKERRARPYAEIAMTRFDYLKLKNDLLANEHELAAQQSTVQQRREEKRQAEHRLAQVDGERRAGILAELDAKATQLAALRADVEKAQQLVAQKELRAPVDGVVQAVAATTTGGVVTPAQALVTLVPAGTPLIVEALLSNDDIGFVKVGQKVDVKIDTFPFQKYGTLAGTLVWVSPDAEDKSNTADPAKPAPEAKSPRSALVYKAHIRPERQALLVDGKMQPLTAGMTVQADIVTDRRRLIEFFLSPVIKYLDEGVKVR